MTNPALKPLYAVMAQGYMIVANGNPLETAKRETREFKTLDTTAKFLFKMGVADFAVWPSPEKSSSKGDVKLTLLLEEENEDIEA